jgi:hypothetical protein
MKDKKLIEHINNRLWLLSLDYPELEWHLNYLNHRKMQVGACDKFWYDIEKKVLHIPLKANDMDAKEIDWILLHEAAHLYDGHDVRLQMAIGVIDSLETDVLVQLHKWFEYNANLITLRQVGDVPKSISKKVPVRLLKKSQLIPDNAAYELMSSIHTAIKKEIALAAEKYKYV